MKRTNNGQLCLSMLSAEIKHEGAVGTHGGGYPLQSQEAQGRFSRGSKGCTET